MKYLLIDFGASFIKSCRYDSNSGEIDSITTVSSPFNTSGTISKNELISYITNILEKYPDCKKVMSCSIMGGEWNNNIYRSWKVIKKQSKLDMEYNSQLEELIIPEYGRNVQRLIFHAKTIEDDVVRQKIVEQIIVLMFQMQPQTRSIEEIRDKLWKHLFRIANYDIKVMPPNGIIPTEEAAHKKPGPVEYPEKEQNFRHYGASVQKLIRKALEMEPGPKREALVSIIAPLLTRSVGDVR